MTEQTIKSGDRYTDSVFGHELTVKYADEDVVLVMDADQDHHHVYSRDDFQVASEKTLMQMENRFERVTDDS